MRRKTRNKLLAGLVLGGFLVWMFGFGGLNLMSNLFGNILPGQPVTGVYVTVVDEPDSTPIANCPVFVYADAQATQLIGTGTTDTSGIATVYGSFESGETVYVFANLADYYPNFEAFVVPAPDANSMASLGQIVITDMYTSTDVTLSITHDNGTALTASANITPADFTGMTLRCTGIASGESMGTTDRATTFSGVEKKDIVTGVIIRIAVTGGSINWATAPTYTVTVGSVIEYIWIVNGAENSAYDSTDGVWMTRLAIASAPPSAISDIDVYIYADGDDLDNTITLEDISNAAFGSYTAAESIANMNII